MRVAIYVSDEHAAPEEQLPPLRAWCMAGGHEVVEEYIDHGVAQDVAHREPVWRPRFGDLYKQALQHGFDLVLAWTLAAFTREGIGGTLDVLRWLESVGVGFHSYAEQGVATDKGLIAVMTALAALEQAWLSERTKIGMHRARERGKRIGAARISAERKAAIRAALAAGDRGMVKIAREIGVGVGTVHRVAHERDDRADVGTATPRVARGPVWR
jgi:DNA invertase Pin-like site-specific DNA recombinase